MFYTGGGYSVRKPVALIIEDHKWREVSGTVSLDDYYEEYLSYVSLQFLVEGENVFFLLLYKPSISSIKCILLWRGKLSYVL